MRIHNDSSEQYVSWANETFATDADYPLINAATYGTAPAAPAYLTLADKPTITRFTGVEPGFAIGADAALFDRLGARYSELVLPVRLGSKAFHQACMKGGGGTYEGYNNLPDLAVNAGISDTYGAGYDDLYRWCKCISYSLALTEGREIMFTPTLRSLGWPESATAAEPAYADLLSSVAPLQWVNVASIAINGVAYRDVVTGITIDVDHGVTNDNVRKDQGDNVPISRGIYLMKPGHTRITGTLNLNTEMDAAQVNAAATSIRTGWGTTTSIVITANDAGVGGSQSFVWTLQYARPTQFTQNGGEAVGQISYSVPFTARIISLT